MLPSGPWPTITMPVTARTWSGNTLPSNPGPIHRETSGAANVIRQTVMPNTSVNATRVPSIIMLRRRSRASESPAAL